MGIFLAILGLALLILAHEFGHFVVARIFKVRVEEFMIGLPGPKILKKKVGNTLYGITAVPFGGYVRLYGEFTDPENPDVESDPESFINKSWLVQIAVVSAGALFNFIIAVVLFVAMYMYGVPGYPVPVIDKVLANSAAEKAGFKPGDRIIYIDSVKVSEWEDVINYVSKKAGKELKITVERAGKKITLYAVPELKNGRGFLGIQAKTTIKRLSFFNSIRESVKLTANVMTTFLKLLVSETSSGKLLKESTGPIGIVAETSKAVKIGFDFYLFLLGLISINLGIVNLIPIPPLDGGRILIIAIEKALGRKIPLRILAFVQALGIILFLYLMVYLIIADIQRYHLIRF